jgi:Zn finger protein HypA/HybF involved in hydrogenase expression
LNAKVLSFFFRFAYLPKVSIDVGAHGRYTKPMSFLKKLLGGGDDQQKSGGLSDIIKQATDLQNQFKGQVGQDYSQMSSSELMNIASGNMETLTGQTSEPKTAFVKKTTCHNCGGAKTLAPKTAYVYCDFCGSLTDYDFQKACENPQSAMPGPAYEELVRQTNEDGALARQTRDRDKYYAIQERLFDRWVELCPNAVSPRAKKDPEYRAQLVKYMATTATVNEFDDTFKQFADQVTELVKRIQWEGMFPKMTAKGETFWPMYEIVKAQLEHSFTVLKAQGVLDMHPDQAPESLQRRMTWSMFCQGWLPTLAEADSEKMIAEAGLKGEYTKLEPTETDLRHCGGCGGELQTVKGGKKMVCEECGTVVDIEHPEVNCKNCAGMISFPVGKNRLQCPYCQAEAQRMAW